MLICSIRKRKCLQQAQLVSSALQEPRNTLDTVRLPSVYQILLSERVGALQKQLDALLELSKPLFL